MKLFVLAQNSVIKSIGKDAFEDLVELTTLNFEAIEIGSIKDFAFRSSHPGVKPLTITFTFEKILKTKLEPNSLLGSNRTIYLIIDSKASSNIPLELNKIHFKPFLDEKPGNTIRIKAPIDCKHKIFDQNSWLLNDIRYKSQVDGKCGDGQDFIEAINSFNNKQSTLMH